MDRLKKRATVFALAALAFSALASAATIEGQAWRLASLPGHDLGVLSPRQSLAMSACRHLFHEEIVRGSAGPGR